MIETRNLSKSFDEFAAVTNVNLTVGQGELLTLLGPNGAGKTTTVRMLTALLRPTAGSAWVNGYDVVEKPMEIRRNTGLLTEHPGVYMRMPGIDYLGFFGQLYNLDLATIQTRAVDLMNRFDMGEAINRRIGEYSKGMRQKLAIIRAMLHNPPVLILDEPTSAMDPQSAKIVRDAIRQLRDEHRTILLCTHNLAEAELLADRIAIIRRGQIIAEGPPADLKLQLLGEPLMEVRLLAPLDGRHLDLDGIVTIEEQGQDWFRYRTAEPKLTNPFILRRLSALGIELVTLSQIPQSLEEVYLRVVNNPSESSLT